MRKHESQNEKGRVSKMANEFILGSGQAHEIELAMNRVGGWDRELVQELCSGNRLSLVREYLLGFSEIRRIEHLVDLDADPFVPNGWSVHTHAKDGPFRFDPIKVKLYLPDEQKTGTISGYKLRELLAGRRPFNANLLDWYLQPENQKFIPEDWKGKAVFFWGTIYRGSNGELYVRYLRWDGRRWNWSRRWLDVVWSALEPALVPA